MSANNQVLIKKYKSKWYVFNNIMAESWSKKNELNIKKADNVCDTKKEAFEVAECLERNPNEFTNINTEYGIGTKLIKDGADVELFNGKCFKDKKIIYTTEPAENAYTINDKLEEENKTNNI